MDSSVDRRARGAAVAKDGRGARRLLGRGGAKAAPDRLVAASEITAPVTIMVLMRKRSDSRAVAKLPSM